MAGFVGALIKRARLEKNLSQEGLCKGICVVSYLSKIEQGKVEAGEDILLPLLKRLGIEYETGPEFLARAGALVEECYETLFSGEEKAETVSVLLREEARLLNSEYMLDALLLRAAFGGEMAESLKDFSHCMDRRQYGLYLLLEFYRSGGYEELLRLENRAFYYCRVGAGLYGKGRYMEAVQLLERACEQAAKEGSVHIMCEARLFLGNVYSDSGQKELMQQSYLVAKRIASALKLDSYISSISYNLAGSYLEWGMTEEAMAQLQQVTEKGCLYYHKLAIAHEKLGQSELALAAVEKGLELVDDESDEKMLLAVKLRLLRPDYLPSGEYARAMEELFALLRRTRHPGYARFHLPWMLELYESQRRYKDAYALSREFSLHGSPQVG